MTLPTYDGETRVGSWFSDEADVYIGRWSGDGTDDPVHMLTEGLEPGDKGYWGNPFPENEYGREECVRRFWDVLIDELESDPERRAALFGLRGQVLGCYCRDIHEDGPVCHGDVLARAADKLVKKV